MIKQFATSGDDAQSVHSDVDLDVDARSRRASSEASAVIGIFYGVMLGGFIWALVGTGVALALTR